MGELSGPDISPRGADRTSGAASRWHAEAVAYDAWFDQPWGAYASLVEQDLLLEAIGLVTGLDVCDAGCGTGRFATRLEQEGAAVVGVDGDVFSLGVAAGRVGAPLVLADVHRMPFDDRSFDVSLAVTVCEFTADPAVVIAELVRITRPGGCVVIGSLNRHSPWGWWNRRQFEDPPWDTARFLVREELDRIARSHGTVAWNQGLYAPTALPAIGRWGPTLERVGRILAPRHGAFEVLTITVPK